MNMNEKANSVPDTEKLLEKQIKSLPKAPGVYQFKDEKGNVLYVGKARNLRQRVKQYFLKSSSDSRFFISTIRKNAVSVETITTSDEGEALILENNLIKQLRPRYNIRLRDDKDYLCLRVDLRSRWPRFELVRRPVHDGARYFGPYHSGLYAKDLYKFLGRHFMLRTCRDSVFKARTRPCLRHQIGRCMAPCTLPVDRDAYVKSVKDAIMVLEGKTEELKARLEDGMIEKSRGMDYETAARIRDLMFAIDSLDAKQRVVDMRRVDTDVIGFSREMGRTVIVLMFVRGGKVIGVTGKKFSRIGSSDEETLQSFVFQYYMRDHYIPREILLPMEIPDMKILRQLILKEREERVGIQAPRRGKGRELVKMAVENAARSLVEWEKMEDAAGSRLTYIAGRLHLPVVPETIECIDISHTSGKEVAGSIVVMEEGEFVKSRYRRFKVKADTRGDDFMAMREVLSRRFLRGVKKEKSWRLPELLLIDGGKGHLNLAMLLKKEFDIQGMSIAAIAKDRMREEKSIIRHRVREKILKEERGEGQAPSEGYGAPSRGKTPGGFDTIYVEGQKDGVPATRSTPLGLLVKIRDEAHRFAIGYHRKLRGKKGASSQLLDIKGVGPAVVTRLYENFKGPEDIRRAAEEEIAQKARISLKLAKAIKKKLGGM